MTRIRRMTTDLLYPLNTDPRSSAKSDGRIAGYSYAHPWKTKKAYATIPNEASQRLHEKLGFREVSRFREVGRKFGRWLDVADYELILRQH